MIEYTRHTVTPEDEAAVLRALRSGYLTQGPEVEAFEAELAALTGARYAVAVNSGTAALTMAYLAHGFPHTTKCRTLLPTVRVPAVSFVATANAALSIGLHAEFVDCDPIAGLANTAHDVGVTLGGQPVTATIVDACHGPISHLGAIATVFSFHPAKHVAAGEGGAVVTNDEGLAKAMRLLRSHGRDGTQMVRLGFNFRMPEMCAALARSQLTRYHAGVAERRRLAAVYDAAFAGHPTIHPVPHGPDSARHLYQVLLHRGSFLFGKTADYDGPVVEFTNLRDYAQHKLRQAGIGTAIHYPVIPLQPYYRERFGYQPGQFPGAEAYAARTLSLPLYPGLTAAEQAHVITGLLEVVG